MIIPRRGRRSIDEVVADLELMTSLMRLQTGAFAVTLTSDGESASVLSRGRPEAEGRSKWIPFGDGCAVGAFAFVLFVGLSFLFRSQTAFFCCRLAQALEVMHPKRRSCVCTTAPHAATATSAAKQQQQ